MASPLEGIVRLDDKQSPICSRTEPFDEHYAFLRGKVDNSAFKAKLLSLPPETWEDELQLGNVRITRPAHDAWGIKKIVFVFCDDFLLKVVDLPWSRSPEWRQYLLPIYEAIGIDESKIVRSLLASMPPGMSIPVHHDTGYWVKHTHRVHVPIITGEEVDFMVGPTDTLIRKITFAENHIIELNNQAKHAVTNNMSSWRVHLIFDYVEVVLFNYILNIYISNWFFCGRTTPLLVILCSRVNVSTRRGARLILSEKLAHVKRLHFLFLVHRNVALLHYIITFVNTHSSCLVAAEKLITLTGGGTAIPPLELRNTLTST